MAIDSSKTDNRPQQTAIRFFPPAHDPADYDACCDAAKQKKADEARPAIQRKTAQAFTADTQQTVRGLLDGLNY